VLVQATKAAALFRMLQSK